MLPRGTAHARAAVASRPQPQATKSAPALRTAHGKALARAPPGAMLRAITGCRGWHDPRETPGELCELRNCARKNTLRLPPVTVAPSTTYDLPPGSCRGTRRLCYQQRHRRHGTKILTAALSRAPTSKTLAASDEFGLHSVLSPHRLKPQVRTVNVSWDARASA